jgi:Ser-tRNA(Ala) deacylase AlaX
MADYNQIQNLCGSTPDYLPKDQPARIVTLHGTKGCPCGGTHVKNISEIGTVKIRKLQVKGQTTRISYEIQ